MSRQESFSINGEALLAKIKELVEEGNVRKMTITDKDNKELLSFPLTVGVVGVVLAPVLAAIGALAALMANVLLRWKGRSKEDDPKKGGVALLLPRFLLNNYSLARKTCASERSNVTCRQTPVAGNLK